MPHSVYLLYVCFFNIRAFIKYMHIYTCIYARKTAGVTVRSMRLFAFGRRSFILFSIFQGGLFAMKQSVTRRLSLFSLLTLFALCSFLLASCGGSSSTGSNGGSAASGGCSNPPALTKKSNLKVGFSQNSSGNPWRLAETKSMQDEAHKRGDQLIVTNANDSDSQQVSDIRSLISQKVDVLVIAPMTETAEAPAVLDAKKACIPVILIDRDVDHKLAQPGSDYVTFIGSDFINQGKRAADWLITASNGKPEKIIELEGTSGSTPAIRRRDGFNNEIASHANMKIVASQDANFARDKGRQVMQTLLQSHPDVTAVYAHNDEMAIGAIQALEAAGKHPGQDVLVCSIDGEKDAMTAIMQGKEGTSVQSSPFFGPVTFDTIDKYAGGQKPDTWIVVKDNQYTKDNVQQYLQNGF